MLLLLWRQQAALNLSRSAGSSRLARISASSKLRVTRTKMAAFAIQALLSPTCVPAKSVPRVITTWRTTL